MPQRKDLPKTRVMHASVEFPKKPEEFLARRELDALQIAAKISSARKVRRIGSNRTVVPQDGQEAALEALLLLLPRTAAEELEELFPSLAREFVKIAGEISMQRAVNRLVDMAIGRMVGKPRRGKLTITLYDNSDVELLLKPMKQLIKHALGIQRGTNPNMLQRVRDTREALRKLGRDKDSPSVKPTQEQVAKALNLGGGESRRGSKPADDARAVRKWHEQCDLTWEEWLELCGGQATGTKLGS